MSQEILKEIVQQSVCLMKTFNFSTALCLIPLNKVKVLMYIRLNKSKIAQNTLKSHRNFQISNKFAGSQEKNVTLLLENMHYEEPSSTFLPMVQRTNG